MFENIKFSIITICYNAKEELNRTLNSIITQTYKNYECIVIDGASEDDSIELIKQHPAITKYISEPDNGVYDAMNKGIQLCSGDFLIFMNAGDTFFNSFVLKEVTIALINNPQCQFLYGDANIIHENNTSTFREYCEPLSKSNICHQSIFYKKELFDKYGKYNTSFKIVGDYDFNLRLIYKNKITPYHINIPICNFYEGGLSSNPKYSQKQAKDAKLLNKIWKNYNSIPLSQFPKIQHIDSLTKISLSSYQEINQSFQKRLIYRLGDNAGLFSEINNMIFAMIWSLDKNIKFELNSLESNIGNQGWNNLFLPFTNETSNNFLNQHNHRYQNETTNNEIISEYKQKNKINFLTQDIFEHFFENQKFINKTFDIKQLEISGNSFAIAKKIAQMIYKLTPQTSESINKIISNLNMPKNYISMQIRAGDIKKECSWRRQSLLTVSHYIKKIKDLNLETKNIFIFTDDYRHVKKLKRKLKNYNIYTLCSPKEKGFNYDNFITQSNANRQNDILKILANIEICKNSTHFIGTRASNPSWFLRFIMPENNISFVDCNRLLWQTQYNKLEEYSSTNKIEKITLFKIIPLLKIIHNPNKLRIKIFNILPIYKIKRNKHYLFGFIPFLEKKGEF